LSFRSLSAHLGDDQPVYGIALPSGPIHDRSEIAMKALASKYIADIRSVFPSGRFHLGGHSLGGLLAFDMARQLTAMGEQVGLLALIDSDRDTARTIQDSPHYQLSPATATRLCKAKIKSLIEKGIADTLRGRLKLMQLKRRVALARRALERGDSQFRFEAEELLVLAAAEYDEDSYPGNAVLFLPKDEFRIETANDLGWSGVIRGKLETVTLPGTHITILNDPHVAALAEELRKRMHRLPT
jgi:thioesterase domain-containing protein